MKDSERCAHSVFYKKSISLQLAHSLSFPAVFLCRPVFAFSPTVSLDKSVHISAEDTHSRLCQPSSAPTAFAHHCHALLCHCAALCAALSVPIAGASLPTVTLSLLHSQLFATAFSRLYLKSVSMLGTVEQASERVSTERRCEWRCYSLPLYCQSSHCCCHPTGSTFH